MGPGQPAAAPVHVARPGPAGERSGTLCRRSPGDPIHPGDQDGIKGLYHVNAVDPVAQRPVVVYVERISESDRRPALEPLLDAFPFVIRGFHRDHGSPSLNPHVARPVNDAHDKWFPSFNSTRNHAA